MSIIKQLVKINQVFIYFTFLLIELSFQNSFGGSNHFLNPNFMPVRDSTSKNKADTSKEKTDRSLSLELDYGTNQTYKGRKSDVKQPYYSTNLNYEAPSGFFIYTSFTNIITKSGSTDSSSIEARKYAIDQLTVNTGYDFKIGKKTDASAGISIYDFYDTAMINYSVKWNLEYSMDHDFKFINEKIILDFDKGRSPTPNDYMVSLESYHSFDINPLLGHDDELSIKPDFMIETGTQNFYTRKNKNLPVTRRNIQSNSKYTVLAYDFTLDVSYSIGKFTIDPALNYSIPVNQPVGQVTKPYGYFTLALIWDFL
jgi:hypothetical protein